MVLMTPMFSDSASSLAPAGAHVLERVALVGEGHAEPAEAAEGPGAARSASTAEEKASAVGWMGSGT